MSVSGISFSGLASGLDTQSIIQALLAVEQRPIQQFERRKGLLDAQKNLFGDLTSKLEELSDAADELRNSRNFVDFKVGVDQEDYLSATATSSAAAGSYEVDVLSVAQAQVNSSSGSADRAQTYDSGTLLFEVDGTTRAVEIGNDNTLDGIASAINGTSDLGVRAQVVDTGDANEPFKLVLTSTEPGVDNGFSIIVDPSNGGDLENLFNDITSNQILPPQDAQILVDGVTITRGSNTVSDVIQGVTLELVGDNGGTADPTRVTVTADGEATSEKVKAFTDKYNEIVDFLAAQSVVDDEGESSSPLFGDSTLRSLRSTLRGIVGGDAGTGNSGFTLLSQIGISADRDGKLSFSQSEFEEALFENESAVKNVFTTESSGIANRLFDSLDSYTDSIDGLIAARTEGIERVRKTVDDNIERAERRLVSLEDSLTQRFANLEVLMNRLQSQGSAIGGFGG